MNPVSIDELRERQAGAGEPFLEFLREGSMSLGLYRLPAGATDPQEPHTEDEVYYVLAGSATIRIGDEEHPVEAGEVIYVERHVEHRFVDIEEELVTLVVFAPARGSLATE